MHLLKIFFRKILFNNMSWHSSYHTIIWYIFNNNCICANNYVVTDSNRANNSCTSTDFHIIPNNGDLVPSTLTTNGYTLTNQAIFTNN